jgi:hypothetical protein
MTRAWPYIAGLLALAPIVLFIAAFMAPNDVLWAVAGSLIGLGWFSTIVFAVYAARTRNVPDSKRWLWFALILIGNAVVLPFFWYWYVWKPQHYASVHT